MKPGFSRSSVDKANDAELNVFEQCAEGVVFFVNYLNVVHAIEIFLVEQRDGYVHFVFLECAFFMSVELVFRFRRHHEVVIYFLDIEW